MTAWDSIALFCVFRARAGVLAAAGAVVTRAQALDVELNYEQARLADARATAK